MTLEYVTKFTIVKRKSKNSDVTYKSPRIYLSTKLTDDSNFPFKEGDKIRIKIQKNYLIIRKIRENSKVIETRARA